MAEGTIEVRGTERVRRLASHGGRRAWRRWTERTRAGRARPPRVFVSFADELTQDLLRSVRTRPGDVFVVLRPLGLNIEATIDRVALLPSRQRRIVVEDQAVLQRLAHASRTVFAPGYHSILRAWRDGSELVCLNERFDEIRIPDGSLRQVLPLAKADLTRFDVSETGSFVHWPEVDAHLGWSQLLALVDETEALRQQQESAEFNVSLGHAIRSLREAHGLGQDAIPELTDRHLRRIESGEQRATAKALEALSRAHGLSFSDYLREIAHRQ